MGDPIGGEKLYIVIVPDPTPDQLAHPDTLTASLAIITKVTIAVEE